MVEAVVMIQIQDYWGWNVFQILFAPLWRWKEEEEEEAPASEGEGDGESLAS